MILARSRVPHVTRRCACIVYPDRQTKNGARPASENVLKTCLHSRFGLICPTLFCKKRRKGWGTEDLWLVRRPDEAEIFNTF